MKYHVNDNDEVKPCHAEVKACRFGVENHFSSYDQATLHLVERARTVPSVVDESYEHLGFSKITKPVWGGSFMVKSKGARASKRFLEEGKSHAELLSDDEKLAILRYGNSGFDVNNYLRGETEAKHMFTDSMVVGIDSSMDKVSRSTSSLYRCLKWNDRTKDLLLNNLMKNSSVKLLGYQSTSFVDGKALNFHNSHYDQQSIFMEIVTDKGVNVSAVTRYPKEYEVILPRDQEFSVVSVDPVTLYSSETKNVPVWYVRLLDESCRVE